MMWLARRRKPNRPDTLEQRLPGGTTICVEGHQTRWASRDIASGHEARWDQQRTGSPQRLHHHCWTFMRSLGLPWKRAWPAWSSKH